jgi:hypothetical protein
MKEQSPNGLRDVRSSLDQPKYRNNSFWRPSRIGDALIGFLKCPVRLFRLSNESRAALEE